MRYLTSAAVRGLLAGLTSLAGYIPYLRDAWRRTSDPDPAAWQIWTIEHGVLVAARSNPGTVRAGREATGERDDLRNP